MSNGFVGKPVERTEDARLLTGRAKFTDDLSPHAAEAAFVRSEHAHARITDIDVDAALDVDGVLGIFTYEDLDGVFAQPLPLQRGHPGIHETRTPYALVNEEAHFVGAPIVMVVARDRYVAEDAVGRIQIQYELLPVVVDIEAAAAETIGPAHSDMSGNTMCDFTEEVGSVEGGFARATHTVEDTYRLARGAAQPMEGRAVIATYDADTGRLQVHDTTQAPLVIRNGLAAMFDLDVDDVEMVAPYIGGGFGVKAFKFYPEEVLIPWAARQLGVTVKWTEDRREHFFGSCHCRQQVHHVKVGFDDDGMIVAYESDFIHDSGAYNQYGVTTAAVTAGHLAGPYKIRNLRYRMRAVFTNTTPNTPKRGAGVPYAVWAIERTLDRAARELGIDRVELRRRNLLKPEDFPYDVGVRFVVGGSTVYDSGNYQAGLELLLEGIDYDGFAAEKERAATAGRHLGLGLACYVEGTGAGPYEGVRVNVLHDGTVTVATGAQPAGQGHETILAQVVADELGIPMEQVRVSTGDSRRIAYGVGTYASRTAVLAGPAAQRAARAVKGKLTALAAQLLDADPSDIDLVNGIALVRSVGGANMSIGQLARAAELMPPVIRGEDEPGVSATAYASALESTFGSGMQAAVVEIDPDRCSLKILRYVAVHDCGKILNPLIVEGQMLGGLAQGIGESLYEELIYDDTGQLLNASFMDYLIPYATEVPDVVLRHTETPSTTNEMGLKGAGEAGLIPVAAVLASAVEDAIGTHVTEAPLSPQRLFEMIHGNVGATAAGR